MISGIDHITINVKEKEATIKFYQDFLGLQPLAVVDMDNQEIRYYRISDETRLELIDYYTEEPTAAVWQKNLGYIRHFALRTNDLDAVWAKCLAENIPVRMQPTIMEKLGCRGILIEDPNGVEVEIVQKLV